MFHILVGDVIPKHNSYNFRKQCFDKGDIKQKDLKLRQTKIPTQGIDYWLRKPQSQKLGSVVLTQHSENRTAKHPPLSACLTSFKRQLKILQNTDISS